MNEPVDALATNCREQARTGLQRGDAARAEQAYARLLELLPDDAEALQFLAGQELGRGHALRAIELLRAARSTWPADAAILHQLGEAQMLAGDLAAAANSLRTL